MLVIGNGESRKGIKLEDYSDIKIGCNAIIRDFYVDHLVCVDRRMVQEALALKTNSQIYTRHEWISSFNLPVCSLPTIPYKGNKRPDEPMQWGSGPYAVLLASLWSNKVKMLGFDLYSETKSVNNLYKDSDNYDAGSKRPVDPRYWIYQIGKVFQIFPQTQFKVYNKLGWILPKEWQLPNVSLDNINTF